jgi:hypothetical protein
MRFNREINEKKNHREKIFNQIIGPRILLN